MSFLHTRACEHALSPHILLWNQSNNERINLRTCEQAFLPQNAQKNNECLGRIRSLEADSPAAHGATEVSTSREMCVQTTKHRTGVVNEPQDRFYCDQRRRKSRTHPAAHFFASPSFQESSSCQLSDSSCRCTCREKKYSNKDLALSSTCAPIEQHTQADKEETPCARIFANTQTQINLHTCTCRQVRAYTCMHARRQAGRNMSRSKHLRSVVLMIFLHATAQARTYQIIRARTQHHTPVVCSAYALQA